MLKPFLILGMCAIAVSGAVATPAAGRPHHVRRVAWRGTRPAPLRLRALRLEAVHVREQEPVSRVPGWVATDAIPLVAVDHLGAHGVASIGYQSGAARRPVEPHEINTAFSAQPIAIGGVVGGAVSLRF